MTVNLDDVKTYQKLDPDNMLARIKELPMQCKQAWQSAMDFKLPGDYADVDKVVILGMGGSAIGGDLIKSLVAYEMKIPIIVHRDYGLPACVDKKTLLIASSYSGNTEETLSGFEPAIAAGAKIIAMTTGGKVQEIAKAHGIPVFKIEYKSQPRAALGFSFIPAIGVLQKLGFIKDKTSDVTETLQVLESLAVKLDEKLPVAKNSAKQIAQRLHGNLTVIYGASIVSEVAHRWKTQINENSKAWAFYEVFPELNHNATVGFPFPADIAKKVRVILLRSLLFNERIKLRYDVTCELLKQTGVAYEFVDGEGQSALAQMVSLVSTGDYVSYYLAMLNKVDPSPVQVINYLKDRLAKG
jgi:glucose/mannose-6-phosphate isomerase